ncbi:MAG: hypothetical protein KUG77_13655 [Nannocystaceae bacterium]|nr:hypothetical protein [Nannocystaceae bacterium]
MTTVRLSPRLFVLPFALMLACDPVVESPGDGSSNGTTGSSGTPTTGAPSSASGTNPTQPPQTTTDPYDPTTGGFGTSSSTGWDTDGRCGSIGCHDVGESTVACDILAQDCPDGEKCAPWANDGGSSWNATRCVPVARNPGLPGDACTVTGSGVSGIDTCALASMCWNVDLDTLEGECIAQCTGTWDDVGCPDPTQTCQISAEGVLNLCHPSCDPITQADCDEGQGCYPLSESFFCSPDTSGDDGAPFGACEFVNACDPGTACANPMLSEACPPGVGGCCLPWCDLAAPDCPGDLACTPWFEEGQTPQGSEFVGLCVDESALP